MCGLILLRGAIFDAAGMESEYGPILGLHQNVDKETAKAGYVGMSSIWIYDVAPGTYRCPRCGFDPMPRPA